ncbi:MAG: outer membrane beta-barrel protein [Crocinitomicaceae bacterium]
MKRKITLITATALLFLGGTNTANAQVEQGSIIIDPYVGAPTWNVWWSSVTDTNIDGYKTAGSPVSFGGRFEYMVADNFGIGLDANYAPAGFQYNEDNPHDTINDIQEFKFLSTRFRIMLRLNYHFVQTENLDAYVGFGAGYRQVTRRVFYDGVDYTEESGFGLLNGSSMPVAVRLAIGARYYFHPNIGLNVEMGTSGGGLIQGGVSVKF